MLMLEELAPPFWCGTICYKTDWPMRSMVRCMNPSQEFCMAVGFDEFLHSTRENSAQRPSETLFSFEEDELYSGVGLTEKPQHAAFPPQPDTKIMKELLSEDPRYDMAVEFKKENNYFVEGESACFTVEIGSREELPEDVSIILENAFLGRVSPVKFTKKAGSGYGAVFSGELYTRNN